MGVISQDKLECPAVVPLQEGLVPAGFLIESPLSTDVEDDIEDELESLASQNGISSTVPCRRRRFAAPRARLPNIHAASKVNKRHWGTRRLRRFENMMMSESELQDICEDMSDMIPDTTTAFSQLFLEQEKMQVWQNFARLSEEDQSAVLRQHKRTGEEKFISGLDEASCSNGGNMKLLIETAEHRFKKVERSCRFLLCHKPAILPRLSEIENELIVNFGKNPTGILISYFESGFDRILVHASAQYHGLKSTSFYDEKNVRATRVCNTRSIFNADMQSMAAYVGSLQQQQNDAVFGAARES